MKYFSTNCWNDYAQTKEIRKSYLSYVDSISPYIPTSFKSLTGGGGDITLNDASVEHLVVSLGDSTVSMVMNGKWIQGTVTGLRIFSLSYTGVTEVVSIVDPDADGLSGSGYGDHGFDEIEVIENNLYEHRMLFSSGIELRIRFHDFLLDYRDVPNPQISQAKV